MNATRSTPALLALAVAASACVESRELPLIPAQAEASYGERLYLKDNTLGRPPFGDVCTRFVPITTSTQALIDMQIEPLEPANCFDGR